MENKGLLFIPDISGFTKFVNETDIGHSRLIIQELLETLINTNQIGLDISEIEGDAILFYKFGDIPSLETIYQQVELMFCRFHQHLTAYENSRFCQCKACKSAISLTLKIITHYGEFTGYNVKNFSKLIGKDVIVAHQLLKNDIEQHEYWLVTDSLAPQRPLAALTEWMQWNDSVKQTETGEISFRYTQLSQLKDNLPPDQSPRRDLAQKTKVLSVTRTYSTDIITLFHATGDLNYRSRWQEGIVKVEDIDHYLPRIGMRSRFILANGQSVVFASSYSYHSDRIEFSETDERRTTATYYILERLSPAETRLTVELYVKKNIFAATLFNLTRKEKATASLGRSMLRLEQLLKEIPSFSYEVT
jgi:hypothetical protein